MKKHDTPEKQYDLERLIFFSDGVFAIAITLLVLELHPPENWDGTLPPLLHELWARLIFYIISFAAIGAFWTAHRFMFRFVRIFKEGLAWLNLLFLATVSLTPLANNLLLLGSLKVVPVTLYVGLMCLISLSMALMWLYMAFVADLIDTSLSKSFRWIFLIRICFLAPVMCMTSLWIGKSYGIWPCIAFIFLALFVSNRLNLKPKLRQEEPSEGVAG